ncbi:anti-sigma factor [Blastococcus sp. KM273128]|uniref:anti-sigma factor n=1 Tax=Blastococcus sp. KM273128 TaxID=2570314 RepID=UPI001F029DAD|nr:anti-sigma factor [Blastococcus sp. KM273128]MCF6745331.1 anti-sigma factor [Blastococcus sp. KM273128]
MNGEHAYDELAVGWALHALEPEDDARFARHLPTCDRCARTVAETSEVMAAMAHDLPAAEPSPALRERLRAAVEETEQLPPRAPAAPPSVLPRGRADEPTPARRTLLPRVLVAAAIAAVVGLGAWVAAVDRARDDLRSTVAAQEQAVAELLQPGRATIAPLTADERQVATVVVREGAVQVVADGLAPNDTSSSTYVLWGLGAGDPVALGAFDVARSQIEVQTVGSGETGLDGFPEYGISIEPGRQAPSAPTEVVATGQVTS